MATKNIVKTLKTLPPEKIQAALEFLTFLRQKTEEEAVTAEILQDKKLLRDIRQSRSDWKKGKGKRENFTPWKQVRGSA